MQLLLSHFLLQFDGTMTLDAVGVAIIGLVQFFEKIWKALPDNIYWALRCFMWVTQI
jgi:hypothetical protein